MTGRVLARWLSSFMQTDGQINFSDDETKLYFGLALPEIYQDTLLLKDEIVDVEVWTYDEPRLYTIQEMQLNNDRKKSFKSVYHINDEKVIQKKEKVVISNQGSKNYPNSITSDKMETINMHWISNPETISAAEFSMDRTFAQT